jgi:hypothetical protein
MGSVITLCRDLAVAAILWNLQVALLHFRSFARYGAAA